MSKNNNINRPEIWLDCLPRPALNGHKYNRGQALIYGAPSLTGATRLAASGCSRIGAGLVTVRAHRNGDIYRMSLGPDLMVVDGQVKDSQKINVVLGGSGGIYDQHHRLLLENKYQCPRVFDADAIPTHQDFSKLDEQCVLTPHLGEFMRMFPQQTDDKVVMAMMASKASGAIVVLKGAETVIAHPNGRTVINNHASPYLAKAGTGDVLAGMISGLIAQGMPLFEACCAAVWMHGEAAIRFGPGLIAPDIIDQIPNILTDLFTVKKHPINNPHSQKGIKMSYYISTTVDLPFEQAIERTKQVLLENGFGVLTTIDLKSTLKNKLNVDFRPYVILGACNPEYAYKALCAEPHIGTMLPCNVIIQDHGNNNVEISAVDPVASMQSIENPDLATFAIDIQTLLTKIIADI